MFPICQWFSRRPLVPINASVTAFPCADRIPFIETLKDHFESILPSESIFHLSGKTSGIVRSAYIEKFNKRAKKVPCVFVMSIQACGIGINLYTATRVILATTQWNPVWEAQAQARAHRMGQTKPVTVFRIVFQGACDQKVQVLSLAHMHAISRI